MASIKLFAFKSLTWEAYLSDGHDYVEFHVTFTVWENDWVAFVTHIIQLDRSIRQTELMKTAPECW